MYLVRIPSNDGYSTGTAFLIAPDTFLTASHVLPVDDDNGIVVQLIRPADPLYEIGTEDGIRVLAGRVIWRNDEADVAAISVESFLASEWIGLMAGLPNGVDRVVTRGFPEGARVDGKRVSTPVSGVLHRSSIAETYHTMEVTIPVSQTVDWEGYSGAPLINPSTGLSVGIVVRARSAFSGAQYLEAVTIDFLLGLSGFLNCFRPHENEILDAVRRSRICALIANGQKIEYIVQTHSHKDWFMADTRILCELGLMDASNEFSIQPVALKLIRHVKEKSGFDYLT